MDLEDLKKRNTNGNLDRIIATVKKTSNFKTSKTWEKDENEWVLTRDSSGNGHAIIRFLPGLESDGLVFVEQFNHGFKYKNRWFIENCPRTIDQKCPVCDHRFEIIGKYGNWDKVPDNVKNDILRPRNNKKSYYANILVIKDPACPENEGKVFKYRFGQKIYDKIIAKLVPEFEDDLPIDISDPKTGCNFRLKCKKKNGFFNYDDSSFDESKPLKNTENILKQQHSLMGYIDPKEFKDYETLEKKYYKIVGGAPQSKEETPEYTDETPNKYKEPQDDFEGAESVDSVESTGIDEDSDDYFDSLAEEIV